MPDVNEKMDIAVESDDFNKIESIATNPKTIYSVIFYTFHKKRDYF